jgi:hypothetical protein
MSVRSDFCKKKTHEWAVLAGIEGAPSSVALSEKAQKIKGILDKSQAPKRDYQIFSVIAGESIDYPVSAKSGFCQRNQPMGFTGVILKRSGIYSYFLCANLRLKFSEDLHGRRYTPDIEPVEHRGMNGFEIPTDEEIEKASAIFDSMFPVS